MSNYRPLTATLCYYWMRKPAILCAGLPRSSQDVRGSRAVNQMQHQGRGMPKMSIRMSVAGGNRARGTRDQLGCQADNRVGFRRPRFAASDWLATNVGSGRNIFF